MFSYTLHAKCDICNRSFSHAQKDLLFGGGVSMIIPPGWRHVLIEGKKPELHLLVCDDHTQEIGLKNAEVPDVAPPATPAEIV